MSNEELLEPRYQIILPYPHSPFTLGEVVSQSDQRIVGLDMSPGIFKEIFKGVCWWEGREEHDMPPCLSVKGYWYNNFKVPTGIYKVEGHFVNAHGQDCCLLEGIAYKGRPEPVHYTHTLPASEAEYTAYQSTQKQP